MKITTLKSVFKSFFLTLILLVFHIEFSSAQNSSKKPEQTHKQGLNNRLLAPIQITGNFSICLPGPSTTQLTGSGGSGKASLFPARSDHGPARPFPQARERPAPSPGGAKAPAMGGAGAGRGPLGPRRSWGCVAHGRVSAAAKTRLGNQAEIGCCQSDPDGPSRKPSAKRPPGASGSSFATRSAGEILPARRSA